MTPAELDAKCLIPGKEGMLWRLVKAWNPDNIAAWANAEMKAGARPEALAQCIGEVCAGAAFGFGVNSDNPREAIIGKMGVVGYFQRSLQSKIDRHTQAKTAGGVFLPKGLTP